MDEASNAGDLASCGLIASGSIDQGCCLEGHFDAQCFDSEGNLLWEERADNLVVTAGKNLALDTYLAGAAYTVTGPFMGLIDGAAASTIAAGDVMTSHAGWLEGGLANPPTYTAPRKTCAWSAASAGAKTLSAANNFVMTGSGTIGGCFLAYGAGATSTIDNTGGILYSAGTFAVAQPCISGNTIAVTYTASM